ncbi:hypothetical protein ABMA79_04855 [Halobacteriovorax sp. HFRX-2_2]|uniref:hypothetical protein n=1 Tax=unclassified Halobacteriovorax TaxID=2639665 RepID=UPI003717C361
MKNIFIRIEKSCLVIASIVLLIFVVIFVRDYISYRSKVNLADKYFQIHKKYIIENRDTTLKNAPPAFKSQVVSEIVCLEELSKGAYFLPKRCNLDRDYQHRTEMFKKFLEEINYDDENILTTKSHYQNSFVYVCISILFTVLYFGLKYWLTWIFTGRLPKSEES